MKILALDIGNTNIKSGLFDRNKLAITHFFQNPAELKEIIGRKKIEHIVISSVSPPVYESVLYVLEKIISIKPYIITVKSPFSFDIAYKSPETLGIDRICGIEGARSIALLESLITPEKSCLMTIDLGTATTINILDENNTFVGGMITPGIETMAKSLKVNTAQLPYIESSTLDSFYGTDTNSSIYAGILYATAGLINSAIQNMQTKTGCKPAVFITGGNAQKVLPLIQYDYQFVRELILIGAHKVYENLLQKNGSTR